MLTRETVHAVPASVPLLLSAHGRNPFQIMNLLYFLRAFFQTKRQFKIGLDGPGMNFFKVEQF